MVDYDRAMRALAFLALATASCSVVTSREIIACDGTGEESFDPAVTAESLAEHCWFNDLDEEHTFPSDGDLVVVGSDPGNGQPQWSGAVEGPLLYRVFDSSFLLVTRVEILNRVSANLCLSSEQRAGLVLRSRDGDEPVTLFVHTAPSELDCKLEGGANIEATVQSGGTSGSLSDLSPQGVGVDGEADIAVCRVGDILAFYVRDPTSTTDAPTWEEVETPVAIQRGGIVEAGLAAAGAPDTATPFGIEAHFTWVAFDDSVGADGCSRALEDLVLPQAE